MATYCFQYLLICIWTHELSGNIVLKEVVFDFFPSSTWAKPNDNEGKSTLYTRYEPAKLTSAFLYNFV